MSLLDNIDAEVLSEFVSETLDQLNSLEEQFVKLENNPGDLEIINAIFRPFHSIKGSAAFFDLVAMKDIAHNIENLLDDLRKEKKKVNSDIISIILQGLDVLKERMEALQNNEYEESLSSKESDYLTRLDQVAQAKPEEEGLTSLYSQIEKAISDIKPDFIKKHPKVKMLVNLFEKLSGKSAATKPGDAIKSGQEPGETNLQYMFNGHNLTGHIASFQQFISKAKKTTLSDDDFNSFSNALGDLIKTCQEENLEPLLPVLNGLKSNFDNIRNSAVDFDELVLSILEDDIEKVLNTVESLEAGEAGAQKVGEILIAEGKVSQEDLEEAVEKQKKVGEILFEEGKISKGDLNRALTVQKEQIVKKPLKEKKKALLKTMRVDEGKIDHFMSFVGELIVSSEVFNYLQKKIEGTNRFPELAKEYKNANLAFNDLSNNLQKSLMEIRKVPVKNLLQKMPRMVRDIAKNSDKNISLEIVGEDTSIDKSILENIENPLIHIIRNAADHGLETKSERLEAGKPEQGSLKINAYTDSAFFYLDVIEDGKGIDPEKIKKAALDKELISQSKYDSISDKEAVRIVLLPGFSTAKKVTDLSGRGVGMDVVNSNLKKVKGMINIDSETGKGTTMQMQIPLSMTLIVVDGLVVQVGEENFIVTISKIKESLRPKSDDVLTVTQKGEMITIREELFPLVRLHELFQITPKYINPSESVVVLVEHDNGKSFILVDELVGQQQVVQKDLGEYLKGTSTISGGAIMGDGSIGLILNVDGIADKVQEL